MTNVEERIKTFDKYLNYGKGLEKKEYQRDGVRWCLENELMVDPLHGVRGGFIADEMGLGKTIMLIGLMLCNYLPHTLIVLPVVLIPQWVAQIKKTTGHQPLVYHGRLKKNISVRDLQNAPIVITSYNTISYVKNVNKKKYVIVDEDLDFGDLGVVGVGVGEVGVGDLGKTLLHQISWDRVIYDEGHHLRNGNTQRFSNCALLKTDIRWIVSGTPVQNSKKDFNSLCSLLKIPLEFYSKKENLNLLVEKFVLKRSKKEVGIQLSEIVSCEKNIKWDDDFERKVCMNAHFILYSMLDGISYGEKGGVLVAMIRARQSCILPCLINPEIKKSSKLDAVVEQILSRKENGNGKLVFCCFKREIKEMFSRLKGGGINTIAIIDGNDTNASRTKKLSQAYDVLILQIQVGCEGLNLQEYYNEIYFVSPHWNPAVVDQAIARCYRIGQAKNVFVFHFIMDGFIAGGSWDSSGSEVDAEDKMNSFDNYIEKRQNNKRKLFTIVDGVDE
jgi:SNF2 family DNA or RNA helicase